MTTPLIICGVDERYAHALQTLMRSIAAAHGPATASLRMRVIYAELTGAARREIADLAARIRLGLDFYEVEAEPEHPVGGWLSPATYLRLAIPEAAAGAERVLYLDCDTLVQADLRPLLDADLGGAPFGAVRDAHNPIVGDDWALPGHEALGIPAGRTYFNAGVMLFDIDRCAATGLFTKATRFLNEHPDQLQLWDQDALNVAADDDWHRLDPAWNVFATSPLTELPDFVHNAEAGPLEDLLADEAHAKILHFAGPNKPWQDSYPAHSLRERWRSFAGAI